MTPSIFYDILEVDDTSRKELKMREYVIPKPKTMAIIKLTDLVCYLYPEVTYLNYRIDSETKEEYVRIHFKKSGFREVCVTADSNIAMIDDVLKWLKKEMG